MDMEDRVDFSVVIPVYNEEEVLPETYRRMKEVMSSAPGSYELIFVNDGSRDKKPRDFRKLCPRR